MDINALIIEKDETILTALNRLNEVSGTGLFVCDNGVLIGTVTDGDIRRYIIKNKNLDSKIVDAANKNYMCLHENDAANAYKVMKDNWLKSIAIVNDDNRIVNIYIADTVGISKVIDDKEIIPCPVVIMAGGKGTRLYPYTKVLPKPLIPIGDEPIVEHIIDQFCQYGCNEYYIVVNHMKNMIKAYFSEQEHPYSIKFVDEDKPLGTGGGLSLLREELKSTFILTNCDILIRDNLYEAYQYHKKQRNYVTMICALQKEQIPYGVVDVGKDGELIGIQEKPEMTFFTNTGCYLVEPEVIEQLEPYERVDFPNVILGCKQKGLKTGVFPIGNEAWLDMGQPEQLDRMRMTLG